MRYRIIFSLLFMAVLTACATTPNEPSTAILEAEQAVATANASEAVHEHAAVAVAKARDYLEQAQDADQAGMPARAEHLAYMAQRQADVAIAMAEAAVARERAEALTEQVDQLRLQARQEELQQRERLIDELKRELSELNPQQTEEGIVLTIGDVLFALDSAELSAAADDPLDELATFLLDRPGHRVRVEGYTDSTGSTVYNQQLSQRRAQTVANAMMDRGISPGRMSVVGYGESDPVAPNTTEVGRQLNRRVEFVILGAGTETPAGTVQ